MTNGIRTRLLWLLWLPVAAPAQSSPPAGVAWARQQLSRPQPDSVRAELFFSLGQAYINYRLDSSLHCIRQGIKLAHGVENGRLVARGYLKLGDVYYRKADYLASISAYQQAERYSRPYAPDSTHLEARISTATIYHSQGNYAKALQLCLTILRETETPAMPPYRQLGMLYTELGIIYDYLHQYDRALEFHKKRLAFSLRGTNRRDQALAFLNLGNIYQNQHKLASARRYYRRALALSRRQAMHTATAVTMLSLGQVAYEQKQYAVSLAYGQQGYQLQRRLGNTEYMGISLLMMAKAYGALRHYTPAFDHLNRALTLFRRGGSVDYIRQVMTARSELLVEVGNYRSALRETLAAQALKDSLMGIDKQKIVAQIQATYDLERKQTQITTLRKNLTIQQQARHALDLQLKLTEQQRLLSVVTALLLGLVLLVSLWAYHKQRKLSHLLRLQKEEITRQADQLTELNATKDKLFSLISHDLRSPVASLKNNIRHIRAVDTDPHLLPLMNRLERQVDSLLALLTNLLDWSMVQLKGFQLSIQPLSLYTIVDEVVSQASEMIQQKQLVVLNQVDREQLVMADRHQFMAVVRNVLANAIKFTPTEGYIRLSTVQKGAVVELHVRDTGVGMTTEQINTLFSAPEIRSGTLGEKGVGLGLRVCREMMDRQGGALQLEKLPRGGTLVRICIAAPAEQPARMPQKMY